MTLASIRRPSEKEGLRWMLPFRSSSASWHTWVPSMSSTARSCTLYVPCRDPAVSQGRPCPDDQGWRCLKPLALGMDLCVLIPSSPVALVRAVDSFFIVVLVSEQEPLWLWGIGPLACLSNLEGWAFFSPPPQGQGNGQSRGWCQAPPRGRCSKGETPEAMCPLLEDSLPNALPHCPFHGPHRSVPLPLA